MQTSGILAGLCEKYTLGKIQEAPRPVEGGLLHQMYHVATDQGNYAVKLLNPDIMRRPDALGNMVNSEHIAQCIAEYEPNDTAGLAVMPGPDTSRPSWAIPVVTALKFQGQHLLCLEPDDQALSAAFFARTPKQYAFVYPWLNAQSLFAPAIGITHCRRIGYILGQIHHADIDSKEMPYKLEKKEVGRPLYDWQGYLSLAKKQQVSWLSEYETMLPDLHRRDKAVVDAMKSVHSCQVISHRDLDPKNVLWQGEQPYLIDWEAAGYINPYQELLEVLNYWGCNGSGRYDPTLCHSLLQAYTEFMDLRKVDWTPLFACSYDNMLGWLEYTLKKSLGLEGDETLQGAKQMLTACQDLRRYEAQAGLLREIVSDQIAFC